MTIASVSDPCGRMGPLRPEVESGGTRRTFPYAGAWSGGAAAELEQPRSEAIARWTRDRTP
jgi:hypothetical protein